jgi:hypothetical protein
MCDGFAASQEREVSASGYLRTRLLRQKVITSLINAKQSIVKFYRYINGVGNYAAREIMYLNLLPPQLQALLIKQSIVKVFLNFSDPDIDSF